MGKTELTKELEKAIWNATVTQGTFGAFEVTIGWFGRTRVDFMTMDTSGIFRFYEIKTSKTDFYSKSDHTFLGHYNYYVMPDELYNAVKRDIPKHIGVHNGSRCIKKPVKQHLKGTGSDFKGYMVRSLCRDVRKLYNAENPNLLQMLEKELQEEKRQKKYTEKILGKLQEELHILKNPPKYLNGTRIFTEPKYDGDVRCGMGTVKSYGAFGYDIIYDNSKEEGYVCEERIKVLK